MSNDLSSRSLLDLFRMEVDSQADVLTAGLLALERNHAAGDTLDACMRAAHSLKGAARVVNLPIGVELAHALEDVFVAAQQGRVKLQHAQIDVLLTAVDRLRQVAATPAGDLSGQRKDEIDACLSSLQALMAPDGIVESRTEQRGVAVAPVASAAAVAVAPEPDRVLRLAAESLNRLLGLAGESLVESRWVQPYAKSLLPLKQLHRQSAMALTSLREALGSESVPPRVHSELARAERSLHECQRILSERLIELDMFERRSSNLSHRLYDEALACRMRPFADGVQALPRTLRDLARALGKQMRFEIVGEATQVDRDILAKLDAPLGHLLRNALDHGLETPDERRAAGKPPEGVLRLEACHSAGALQIRVSDDGRGVNFDALRAAIVRRELAPSDGVEKLSEAELLEFLFLPGFSLKGTVNQVSGRGVGLDVVQDMVKQVRGTVRVTSTPGKGTTFHLQLPVTLSVVRTLVVEIGGEPFAFPLVSIIRALSLPKERIEELEGRQHFVLEGRSIGLVAAHRLLEMEQGPATDGDLHVVVLGDAAHAYGLVVTRFLGERELVVQPLAPQLGKVKDIAAGALMDDGSPVLIVDPEDMVRSADRIVAAGRLATRQARPAEGPGVKAKRILVVDDSLTVRELERKLLLNHGYEVEVAVDGIDGWNVVRGGGFNLVVTDIDMPRMDGIELVTMITRDPNLKNIPVMIVSYKDRDEDRRRGLEAGAAHYLTKSSFHDETLVQAVVDLIGEAVA